MPDSDVALLEQSADLRNGQVMTIVQPDPILLAIEKGMDADAIAKIVGLIEGRERQQAEKDFTQAVAQVTARAGVIIKSKQGSKGMYAPLDMVNHILTPLYTAAGLSLSFSEADCPLAATTRGEAEIPWKRHVCDVRHKGGHKERYHVDLPLDNADGGNKGMSAIQGAISTGSYAQRVLLCRIFNLTIALTDLDGDASADRPVDADEIAELESLIETFKDAISPKPFHFDKFLKVFGGPECERLSDLTLSQFEEARRDLRSQIAGAKKGAK